eukprot:scpid92123/ scgid12003/ Fibrillin-3
MVQRGGWFLCRRNAFLVMSLSQAVAWTVMSTLLCSLICRPLSVSVASAPASRPPAPLAYADGATWSSVRASYPGVLARAKRQAVGGSFADILNGRVDPNCTAEDEQGFICPLFARCYNLPEGLTCVCGEPTAGMPCPGDLDECFVGTHNCGSGGRCENNFVGFMCSCDMGYMLDSTAAEQCVDVNECADSQLPCHSKATCLNSVGSYMCQCSSGYRGDGFECTDVNECEVDQFACHVKAVCENTPGSFLCQCAEGFTGDGRNCLEIPAPQTTEATILISSRTNPSATLAPISAAPARPEITTRTSGVDVMTLAADAIVIAQPGNHNGHNNGEDRSASDQDDSLWGHDSDSESEDSRASNDDSSDSESSESSSSSSSGD